MSQPTIGSLFSGYGGLDIAVQNHCNATVAWHSEIDVSANKILLIHNPDIPNLGDVTQIEWTSTPPVDILTGGYPCQPFSQAGKREGANDERHLWPYVCTAIDALRPSLVVLENVRGHLTLGFGDVLADLSRIGYDARWSVVRASEAGACHSRARLFIAAYPSSTGLQGPKLLSKSPRWQESRGTTGSDRSAIPANPNIGAGKERDEWKETGCDIQCRDNTSGRCICRRDRIASPYTNSDGHGEQLHPRGMGGMESGTAEETQEWERSRSITEPRIDWGKYEQAVRKWEAVTREAPSPTIERDGRPRLSPLFVEWMMGLDEGHVTGHGLTSANELKMLGNGVCPQQAELALSILENM